MGVPAHVVRDAVRPMTRQKQLQIAETMMRQFHELLQLKGVQVDSIETVPHLGFRAEHNGKKYRLGFTESHGEHIDTSSSFDGDVLWTFDSANSLSVGGVSVMNLLAKSIHGPSGLFADSAREFLRKRGIRLQPSTWRYEKGLI